jgi:hypothetical protein
LTYGQCKDCKFWVQEAEYWNRWGGWVDGADGSHEMVWHQTERPGWRSCMVASDEHDDEYNDHHEKSLAKTTARDESILRTHETFGCIQFETKS